jgi:hypothetical protein
MPNPRTIEVSVDDLKLLIQAMDDLWLEYVSDDHSADHYQCLFCDARQFLHNFGVKPFPHDHKCPLLVAQAIMPKD